MLSYDLICLSHLRWDFVYQRPHHLMSRFARDHRVFYLEEPVWGANEAHLTMESRNGVHVVAPHLPHGADPVENQRALLDDLLEREECTDLVLWYYTPMAVPFSQHLAADAVIYDCMDELSAFVLAPPELRLLERELLSRADLVFTGGRSLYERKQRRHRATYCFPSSVDVTHFAQARGRHGVPDDAAGIPSPQIGFFGVIDERMDLDLLGAIANRRPDWHLVMIGPTAKIDPDTLPAAPNVHYLGPKRYDDLPTYLATWDVAILPFAHNEATRYISPTKTPEYLAAGKPVVSTSIRDVVHPYAENGLVAIADNPDTFIAAIDALLTEEPALRRARADRFLQTLSWDRTWSEMNALINEVLAENVEVMNV
ncbi:MAG TPA: glycosyltransferase family 1 protein [Chloroflexota bacterium]|nr:glycosyltransferase family 1 protein [Chloroflexota bacterium]